MDNLTKFDRVPHGYPKLAALITKNEEFAVFREFRWLNTRNLLYLQAELSALEVKLKEVDMGLKNENCTNTLRSYPAFVEDDEQRVLVDQIRVTLKEYNEALIQYKSVLNFESPHGRHLEGLKQWIQRTEPITDASMGYLSRDEPDAEPTVPGRNLRDDPADLVTLNHEADSWLGTFLRHSSLKLFFMDVVRVPGADDKDAIIFYDSTVIDKLVTALSTIIAALLAVAGLVTLHFETREGPRLGLIVLYTVLVASVIALAGGKKSEVFMGTIGYVAVLVVFVSGDTSKPA